LTPPLAAQIAPASRFGALSCKWNLLQMVKEVEHPRAGDAGQPSDGRLRHSVTPQPAYAVVAQAGIDERR